MKRILLLGMIIFTITIVVFGLLFIFGAFGDEILDLIPAIVQVESGGNPNAVSKAGAVGLMQITPQGALAEWNKYGPVQIQVTSGGWIEHQELLNRDDLFDPRINVIVGEWYLRRLKDHYLKDEYTLECLLCAWNGGITRLRKLNYDCGKMPRESKTFTKKVLKLYEENM